MASLMPSSQNPAFRLQGFHLALREDGSERHKFTQEEDEQIKKLVAEYGENNWNAVASHMKSRSARQCRERYRNYLSASIKNGAWTDEEDNYLRSLYQQYGPHWSKVTLFFPTRSEINVKNHWTSLMKQFNHRQRQEMEKRLIKQKLEESSPKPASPVAEKAEEPDSIVDFPDDLPFMGLEYQYQDEIIGYGFSL